LEEIVFYWDASRTDDKRTQAEEQLLSAYWPLEPSYGGYPCI